MMEVSNSNMKMEIIGNYEVLGRVIGNYQLFAMVGFYFAFRFIKVWDYNKFRKEIRDGKRIFSRVY